MSPLTIENMRQDTKEKQETVLKFLEELVHLETAGDDLIQPVKVMIYDLQTEGRLNSKRARAYVRQLNDLYSLRRPAQLEARYIRTCAGLMRIVVELLELVEERIAAKP